MCVLFVTQLEQTDTVSTTEKTQRKHLPIIPPILGLAWALEDLGCLCFFGAHKSIGIVGMHFPNTRTLRLVLWACLLNYLRDSGRRLQAQDLPTSKRE